jgi:GT2 family glycosyltransferase
MSTRTTAIIVSFNSADYLRPCLESIACHAPGMRIVVVDNASSDGSADIAATAGSHVEVVRNASNVGFGRAVNDGLARISSEFILLMNPDCCLPSGAVEHLVAELDAHPECAIAGPQILNLDGGIQGSARGDPTWATGLFGRSTLLTRLLPDSSLARRNVRTLNLQSDESFEADWVSGACLIARRAALTAIGGFDPRYFLYWEDADLCLRLRKRGHTVRYAPAAKVTHVGGCSRDSAQALATHTFHQSAYTYYATHIATSRIDAAVAWCVLKLRGEFKAFFLES